jgi:eukaryotic-like serine/threonine-protein kinase
MTAMTHGPSAVDQPGRVLGGKYELCEPIGRGGMAIVWRGLTHGAAGFRRPVAIKRIDVAFKGYPEVTAMFVEEARVGAALRHPNIVQIHDFGTDEGGDHYLVTEWVDGLHFGEWVQSFKTAGRETPWPLVAAIGVEVLRAIHAAHIRCDEQGQPAPILHRDVTPPNILIDECGVVKLADFGLARAMDRGRMTRPNVVKGKLSYLAPELVMGEPPSVQSDVFSLGVVLWESLAMKRLFDAPTDVEVVRLLREGTIPLLSYTRPSVPMGLTTTVHRALEREPRMRFGSAIEMLRALTGVLRILPDSTDASALAQSVALAREQLSS